jgi:hypothetical protein
VTLARIASFVLFFACAAHGQDIIVENDTANRSGPFSGAKFSFRARSVYMTTLNDGPLKDDYALAAGVGAGVISGKFHGFQAGVSGFVTYNLLSSDLAAPDPTTNQPNRYEIGLFDIERPAEKYNLARPEELFLRYSISASTVTVGRMKLISPFMNPQDGRMNVTMEEGAWLNIREIRTLHFNAGWFWAISPRSTTKWYPVGSSLGLYPAGITTDGRPSAYRGNIRSDGVGLAQIVWIPSTRFKVTGWNTFIDNVMNAAMIEIGHSSGSENIQTGDRSEFYQGLIFIHQDAIHSGGNRDQSKTYVPRGFTSNAVSAQLGMRRQRIDFNLNFTHITGDGRYIAPREWGRDPFYTFMFREKNDGFGNVNAASAKLTYSFLSSLKATLAYGYFRLPDVTDYRLNKYGMPSYTQLNFDMAFVLKGVMKGFLFRIVSAWKMNEGETYGNARYVYNKINMANISVILDYVWH